MDEYYSSPFSATPQGKEASPDSTSKWLILLKILIWVCSIALAALLAIFFLLPLFSQHSSGERGSTVAAASMPVMQLDDEVFTYNGEVVLDGKAHNVSIRIDGITTEDAVQIVKAYVGG